MENNRPDIINMNPAAYEKNPQTQLQESGVVRGLRLAARAAFLVKGNDKKAPPQLILVILPVSQLNLINGVNLSSTNVS